MKATLLISILGLCASAHNLVGLTPSAAGFSDPARTSTSFGLDSHDSTRDGRTDSNLQPPDSDHLNSAWFRFYYIGSGNKVGLRNNASEPLVAVLNFNYNNGSSQVREFRVEAFSSIEVDKSGTSLVEIIGDKPAK